MPNGSSAPGHYSGSKVEDPAVLSSQRPNAKRTGSHTQGSAASIFNSFEINREADVFGDDGSLPSPTSQRRMEVEWQRSVLEQINKETVKDP